MALVFNPITGNLDQVRDFPIALEDGGTSSENASDARKVLGAQQTFSGLEDQSLFSLAYDVGTRTITVTYSSGAATWVSAQRFTYSGSEQITHPNTTGLYWVYYNISGILTVSPTFPGVSTAAPFASLYYNAETLDWWILSERHPAQTGMDDATHANLHLTRGCQTVSGMVASGYTVGSSTDAGLSYAISSGRIADEDLYHNIPDLLEGGPYTIVHRSGTTGGFVKNTTSTVGILQSGGNIVYNQFTGVTWQLTPITSNNIWVNYFVAAWGAELNVSSLVVFPSQQTFTSLADAQSEDPRTAISGISELSPEICFVYRVTYRRAVGGNYNARIDDIQAIRSNNISVLSGFTPSDHSSLTGRSTPSSHPETAISFTDVTTGDSSTTAHGYLPKLSGLPSDVLKGDGTWADDGSAALALKADLVSGAVPVSQLPQSNWLPRTVGIRDAGSLVSNGDGTLTAGSNVGFFYTDSTRAVLEQRDIAGGTVTLTDQDTNYIVADYNTLTFVSLTDFSLVDYVRYLPYAECYRNGNNVHVQLIPFWGNSATERYYDRKLKTSRYARESGLDSISVNSSLEITIAAGIVWSVDYPFTIPVSSTASRGFSAYHVGGAWTTSSALNPKINNQEYDNGTDKVALATGEWTINYIYRGVELQDHVYITLGQQAFASSDLARASSSIQSPPEIISSHAMLVGRVIVEKDATTGFIIESAFDASFGAASAVVDHSALLGLQGGMSGQYYHMTLADYNARELTSRKGVANGYLGLDSSGVAVKSQLATGTPTSSNFLRGDGTWAIPAGGGGGGTSSSYFPGGW